MLTLSLLKRRSEHHDGAIGELEEISLHQFDLENVDLINKCIHLKLLYLMNNQLRVLPMMRLYHLHTLYLQMNNLTSMYGLAYCTQLVHLDVTLNFIDSVTAMYPLVLNKRLRVLVVQGNPFAVGDYRKQLHAFLKLAHLDFERVADGERQEALVAYPTYYQDAMDYARHLEKPSIETFETQETQETLSSELNLDKTKHCIRDRIAIAKSLQKKEDEVLKKPKRLYVKDSKYLQCHELDFKVTHTCTKHMYVWYIKIPTSIPTTDLSVDVLDDCLILIYGCKRIQMRATHTVFKSTATRHPITGTLIVYGALLSSITDLPLQFEQDQYHMNQCHLNQCHLNHVPINHLAHQQHLDDLPPLFDC